ncbi:MAG: SDR family NAD(P)-dependent oxidoreductase [Solirubrobacteraceae bacterium]
MRMKDRVAIVTGAGQGIGEAAARRFAAEGAKVIVSDVNDETGGSVAEAIERDGGQASYVHADVSAKEDVRALIAATRERYGRLDVLHNNAGVHETNFTAEAQSHELAEEVWDKVVAINLKGAWMCSKYAAPLLAESGGGAIVNAASIGGLVGYPMGSAYGPSKAGIVQLTRVMAIELAAQNTRVNCYAPGNTDTPMVQKYYSGASPEQARMVQAQLLGTHLIARLARPEEIANVVLFLASDESSAMTGACIVVDQGTTAWRGLNELG